MVLEAQRCLVLWARSTRLYYIRRERVGVSEFWDSTVSEVRALLVPAFLAFAALAAVEVVEVGLFA